uniref:Uncharacterized protein n=1 Tax=Buteo japonicus TaxID=224669 RepID=A0A8B9Z399_9AVES
MPHTFTSCDKLYQRTQLEPVVKRSHFWSLGTTSSQERCHQTACFPNTGPSTDTGMLFGTCRSPSLLHLQTQGLIHIFCCLK